jgi:penicillin-binding protein 1C
VINWIGAHGAPYKIFKISSITLIIGLISFLISDHFFSLPLPSEKNDFARVVVDEHGRPLRAFADSNGVWRYQTKVQDVSTEYIEALLHYEDRWFYYHPGINPLSLLRASIQNIFAGRIISGGSTLTMQVARTFDPHERSYSGKLQQAFRALQLEWHFSKEQILSFYLNYVPFGGPVEGVAAASYMYLDKAPNQLTHAEAALMAVLPQRPSFYRPDRHPQRAQKARDKVLNRMQNTWPEEIIAEAKQEPVAAYFHAQPSSAPLFARFAKQQKPDQAVIKTTLNLDLQQQIESYTKQQVSRFPRGTSIAALIVDHHSMQIKAYAGSADFTDNFRFGHVDMVQAIRSPGSTLKPFLYGLAIDEGLIHSHSLLTDAPQQFGSYQPHNFSGGFNGPVTVTEALQRSLNIPAVQVLQALGTNKFSDTLSNAGITLSTPDKANLSIILGGTGTSLWQLVKAYSALANQGQVDDLHWDLSDLPSGKNTNRRFLMSEGASWIIRNILNQQKRADQLNLNRSRYSDHKLAWKTGTSYGFRDAWAIGINEKYTLGVWVGRPDSTPLPGYFGANSAAPILMQLHNFLTDEQQTSIPVNPASVTPATICWPLGNLLKQQPDKFCHQQYNAWILDQNIPPTLADLSQTETKTNPFKYWVNPDGKRVQPSCSQMEYNNISVALWPLRVEPWIEKTKQRSSSISPWSSNCKKQNTLQDYRSLHILGINDSTQIVKAGNQALPPSVALKALGGSGSLQWYINGLPYPDNASQNPAAIKFEKPGNYQISVVDEVGNVDRVEVEVIHR